MKLLVANRGEIAIRIMRAAAELNIRTVGIYSQDDAVSLHTAKADETFKLSGMGSHVYRNIDQIIQAAQNTECDAIHPGYGFLSESSEFARRCSQAGILFIGSKPEQIQLFSDKTKMREVAIQAGVPVVPGIEHAITIDDGIEFLAQLDSGSSAIIKAIFGSKGRAIQIVSDPQGMTDLFARCKNEALGLFGNDDLYIEQFLP
ncbi:MAG TPA: carbamoyl-phosphate synthase large subunit, partial [Gammaproteobacteria bacterium]|nr:carbamoyl-phosphate synthase large subunit [Gammaproteobacteria bacterium]